MEYDYDKIKSIYKASFKRIEEKEECLLEPNSFYIIRLDGKGMTKRFKPKKYFINKAFLSNIQQAFFDFCNHHLEQVIFGFQCNDEISLLIKAIKEDDDNTYNRKEKLLSLFASEISIYFNNYCLNTPPEEDPDFLGERVNIFDARIFKISKNEIVKYFCLRQSFGIEHILTRIRNKTGSDQNVKSALLKLNNDRSVLFGNIFKCSQRKTFEFLKNRKKLNDLIFCKKA